MMVSALDEVSDGLQFTHADTAIRASRRHLSRVGESLHIEVFSSPEVFRTLHREWKELFVASGISIPFASPDWCELWWSHFSRRTATATDELRIYVARSSTGRLVGVAPMMLTSRPSVGPLRLRALQFLGADPNLTEIRTALCAPGWNDRVHRALHQYFEQSASERDFVAWSAIPEGAEQALAATPGWQTEGPLSVYLLSLPESWDHFRAGLKRNVRESLRKCYNSLKRDGLTFSLEVASSSESLGAAAEHLFRLHAARSEGDFGVRHPNVFETTQAKSFFRDVVDRLGRQGHVRAFSLVINHEVVAVRFAFVFERSLYLYYSGFDPRFAKYSVMTTTVAEIFRWSIGEGIQTVNLSTGTDASKTRWGPSEVRYHRGRLLAPGRDARLKLSAFDLTMAARRNLGLLRSRLGR
jgi:CelD/BcsL family acetyltransferase involved in cellulose biosynthesis